MSLLVWLLGGSLLLTLIIAYTAHIGTNNYISYNENTEEAKKDVLPVKLMIWFFVLLIMIAYGIIMFVG